MSTSQVQALRIPSVERQLEAGSEWFGRLHAFAKLTAAAGELVPFPFVKTATGVVEILLEMLETVNRNKDDLRNLVLSIIDIVVVIRDDIIVRAELSDPGYVAMCTEFNNYLLSILNGLNTRKRQDHSLTMQYTKSTAIRATFETYKKRIDEMRANFMLLTLVGTRFAIADLRQDLDAVRLALSSSSQRALPSSIHQQPSNDIDIRSLAVELHKAVVALRSEISPMANPSDKSGPYAKQSSQELPDMQVVIEEIYKEVTAIRSDISSGRIPSRDSVGPGCVLPNDVETRSIADSLYSLRVTDGDTRSMTESFYSCLEESAINVDARTVVTEMYEEVTSMCLDIPCDLESVGNTETPVPPVHRSWALTWFNRRRGRRYIDARTGLEVDRRGYIESCSGEPQTFPTLRDATLVQKMPILTEDLFTCRGAVDAAKLLRISRATSFEKALSVGANVLVDETWTCTIRRKKDGMFSVHIRYNASASHSEIQDPQRPIALDQARSVPGLMTILDRR